MKPTYSAVTGDYRMDSSGNKQNGPLTGTVDPDGTVHLTYGSQFGGTEADYKFCFNRRNPNAHWQTAVFETFNVLR